MTAWPFPGDSTLDRARRIAQSYRSALHAADPSFCEQLDARAAAVGEGWVVPRLTTLDLDDEVTLDEAAELVGRTRAAVHKWVSRKGLPARRHSDGKYRVAVRNVLDMSADMRRARAAHRSQAISTTD